MKNSEIRNSRTGYVFLLIFILLSVGIATGGYFAYRNYEKNYRTEIENQLSAVAELKVNQLVQWRKERLGDGQVFYKNDLFSAIVKRYIQNRNDRDAKAGILTWAGQVQGAFNYDLMMLLDAQWNTILVYPENKERVRLVIDQKNTEILLSGNMTFQDFYRNDQDHHIYLKILVPILDDHSPKRLIAVLALRIDPAQYLYPMIEQWPTPSRTSETLIIRKDGNDALFVNNLKFHKDAALNLRVPITNKDVLAVKSILGKEGIVEGIDYRGEQVIGYVRTIPDSPWFLVARMDMEEVYAPLKERFWLMIVLAGALFIGAGASIGLVWRQQRSRFYRAQYESAESLRESKELLQSIVDNSTSLIYIVDTEGKFLLVNRTLISLLSVPREKLLGQPREIVLPKNIAETHRRNDLHVLDSGIASIFEEVNMEQDGKHTYLTVKFPLYNAEKKIYAVGGMSTDITDRKRAVEALQESEAKFRQTFDVSPVGIVMVGLDKKFLRCNNSFSRSLGYLTEELIGKSIEDITLPEDRHIGMAEMKAIVNGEIDTSHVQKRYLRKDGQSVWGEVTISLVRDSEKRPQYFLAIIQDITESKRAEDALRESQSLYHSFIEQLPNAVFRKDYNGRYVMVNSQFCKLKGAKREDFIGRKPMEVAARDIPAQGIEGHASKYANVGEDLHEQILQTGRIFETEEEYLNTDGSIQHLYVVRMPVFDFHRTIIGTQGIMFDVTDRKLAEERIRSSEAKYRHLFNNAVEGVYQTTPEGKLISVNKAFVSMFGYESSEEMIATITDIAHQLYANPEDRKIPTGILREKGFLKDFEMKMRRKDGSEIWTSLNARLNKSSQGEIFFEGFISDITERKKIEKALRVSKERLLFATDGAHLGIWNWNTVTGELIWSNQCKALFGIPQNETMSYQRFSDALHPDDRARTDKAVNDALKNHTDYDIEYRSLWPDGSIHWLAAKGRGFYDATGKALRLEGIVLDITERKKNEDALRESERRLSEANTLAQLGHWIWDIKTGNVEWSDEVYNIFQLDRNEFTPQIDSILSLSPWPEDHERDKELIRKAMETHEKGNYEQRFLRPNKSIGYYFSTFQGRYDDKGNLILIVGTVQDITERKRAEEKIFTLALRQEAILSAVPDIIMEVNNDRIYTWANQAGIDFFGDDVIGKEASFYFEGEQETYKTVQPLFKGDENVVYLESCQRRKDGEKRLLAWWCRVLKDENGKITGALSSASDITELKQVEEALAESEKKNRALFETMSEGIVYEDHDGKIISANPAAERLLGLSVDQMQGRTSLDPRWKAIHEDGSLFPGETHSLHIAAKTGKPATGEVMGIYNPKSNTYVWLSVNSTPEYLPGEEKPFRAYAVFRDITERKRAEDEIIKLNAELEHRVLQRTAQLEATNKELEAFSYSVSHDLRAPLRHVSGYVDLLGKQYQTELPEKGQHYLDEITDSTHQMGVLIDDLLNFSKSGRVEMHESVLDMSGIVEEVQVRIRQDNSQRDIEWSVAHMPSVHCDNAMMHLVWENLLSNAVKFTRTRKKAKIEIGVREEGKEFVFFVRDNGVGFDMQYAQKLFGVFQRLHPAAEYEGTGVGLANVRRIILRHGGRTWAEAELEKGATFYFSLPK